MKQYYLHCKVHWQNGTTRLVNHVFLKCGAQGLTVAEKNQFLIDSFFARPDLDDTGLSNGYVWTIDNAALVLFEVVHDESGRHVDALKNASELQGFKLLCPEMFHEL